MYTFHDVNFCQLFSQCSVHTLFRYDTAICIQYTHGNSTVFSIHCVRNSRHALLRFFLPYQRRTVFYVYILQLFSPLWPADNQCCMYMCIIHRWKFQPCKRGGGMSLPACRPVCLLQQSPKSGLLACSMPTNSFTTHRRHYQYTRSLWK